MSKTALDHLNTLLDSFIKKKIFYTSIKKTDEGFVLITKDGKTYNVSSEGSKNVT